MCALKLDMMKAYENFTAIADTGSNDLFLKIGFCDYRKFLFS